MIKFELQYFLRLCLFLCLFFFSCENDLAEVQKMIKEEDVNKEIGKGVELTYSDSGRVEMKIIAPVLYRHLDRRNAKREFPEGLEVLFLDKEQKIQSRLTGKYAIEEENNQQITVRDSVVLLNLKKEKLETNELIWNQATNIISTPQFVRITTQDEIITGYGFEADRAFTYWKILVPQGRVKIKTATPDP